MKDWDSAIDFCRQDRQTDMPAYQAGRLATLIQKGEMTSEEAVARAAADHLVDAPDETCLNRMYLFIRFIAIAAEHSPENSAQREP